MALENNWLATRVPHEQHRARQKACQTLTKLQTCYASVLPYTSINGEKHLELGVSGVVNLAVFCFFSSYSICDHLQELL